MGMTKPSDVEVIIAGVSGNTILQNPFPRSTRVRDLIKHEKAQEKHISDLIFENSRLRYSTTLSELHQNNVRLTGVVSNKRIPIFVDKPTHTDTLFVSENLHLGTEQRFRFEYDFNRGVLDLFVNGDLGDYRFEIQEPSKLWIPIKVTHEGNVYTLEGLTQWYTLIFIPVCKETQ